MENFDPTTQITMITIIIVGVTICIGTITPTIMEGIIAKTALEGMARQPDAAGEIRMGMIIAMALCETASIYVLLIELILLFANPLITRFFGG